MWALVLRVVASWALELSALPPHLVHLEEMIALAHILWALIKEVGDVYCGGRHIVRSWVAAHDSPHVTNS